MTTPTALTATSFPILENAACADTPDPDVFFPDKGESYEKARRICGSCPERLPCLEYALIERLRHGMWGGLTETERMRLALDRGLPPPRYDSPCVRQPSELPPEARAALVRRNQERAYQERLMVRRGTVAELTGQGWSAAAIAKHCGIPKRKVYKDRLALKRQGAA